MELCEGRFKNTPGLGPPKSPDEIDGHIVRRPKRRPERIGTGRRQPGQGHRVETGLPQHDRVPLDVDAAPPGPPGELGVLTGGDVGAGLAVELAQPLQDDRARRHVDAECQGLGGEHGTHEAADEQLLDHFLERGQHPGVVRGDAALKTVQPLPVAEYAQVVRGDARGTGAYVLADALPLLRRGQPQAGAHAGGHRGVTARPAEHEGDRREQPGTVEMADDLGPAGYPGPLARCGGGPAPATRPRWAAAVLPGQADQIRVDPGTRGGGRLGGHRVPLGVRGAVGGERAGDEQVVQLPVGQHVLPQWHRAVLGDDDPGVAADGDQPVRELLRVAHRRRQRHQLDIRRQVNDHLFPDGSALPVGEVVHLVHDDEGEPVEAFPPGRLRVEHVAQDLGGHDDHRRVRVAGGVAGEQADRVSAVAGDEIGVLLVRQRLDRGRVEAALPAGEREVGGELADDRLTGPGGRRDQDALTGVERGARLDLEGVETEGITAHEVGQSRGYGRGESPGPGRRARRRGGHFVSLRPRRRAVAGRMFTGPGRLRHGRRTGLDARSDELDDHVGWCRQVPSGDAGRH